MPTSLTTELFVKKAKEIEGNSEKFDYSFVEYKNYMTPIKIMCKEHGDFNQKPNNHLSGAGCPKCAAIIRATTNIGKLVKNTSDTLDDFLEKARRVHGETYDYSRVNYVSSKIPVEIICKEHGLFVKAPSVHINNKIGCPKCKGRMIDSFDSFLTKSREIHGDLYDYSLANYKNTKTKIDIVCKIHGVFSQSPHLHLQGNGCFLCSQEANAKISGDLLRMTFSEFESKAKSLYGDKYEYRQEKWEGAKKRKIDIICSIHGVFEMNPDKHINGKQGCPRCGEIIAGEKNRLTNKELLDRFGVIHKGRYLNYDLSEYKGQKSKIKIECKNHGWFEQSAGGHLAGNGCPRCSVRISKPEQELYDIIKSLFPDAIQSNRSIIKPKELDIVIPSKKIAIEFNGLAFHSDRNKGKSDNYHLDKSNSCKEVGYRLIHIWEDDWRDKRDVVIANLKHILGKSDKERIYARKCSVEKVTVISVNKFMNDNHIQGWSKGKHCYILKYEDETVAAMIFSHHVSNRGSVSNDEFELVRYATDRSVVGGAGKLMSAFLKDVNCKSVVSYSSNEMYSGEMYSALGFKKISDGKPDYKVVADGTRRHKSGFRREVLQKKLGEDFDPALSERENCRNNGLFRVYNCGLTKWQYTNNL